jgi:hypothetical protein
VQRFEDHSILRIFHESRLRSCRYLEAVIPSGTERSA